MAADSVEFGDNYMVFDDYRVTAAPASAPRLELVERQADGTAVIAVDGESGQEFALEFSDDLATWAILVTDTIPDSGRFTYDDAGAADKAERFYRTRVIP
jgi:hypothetical protein